MFTGNSNYKLIMNKYFLFITFIVLFYINSTVTFSQENKLSPAVVNLIENEKNTQSYSVWIFFSDKGTNINSKMAKAESNLSAHCLQRRCKSLKTNNSPITFYDIPVEETYIDKIVPYISKIRTESRWLNAISAEVTPENFSKISQFDFVKKIDLVRKKNYQPQTEQEESKNKKNAPDSI